MIDLGKPALHVGTLTVFADHADPRRFHYLPDVPHLRHDANGTLDVRLLKYRVDEQLVQNVGNGLLMFTVELAADADELEEARALLAAHARTSNVALEPVAVEQGRVGLAVLDHSTIAGTSPTPTGFVLRVSGGDGTMLFGTKAASFSVVLTAAGATLLGAALMEGTLPVSVFYALTVSGLRPALRATITPRWDQAYTFFENRFHGGKLLLATDIGPTMEELVRTDAISIEIDELLPAEQHDETSRRALDAVQRYVLEELFTPTLGETPPSPSPDGLATIGTTIKDIVGFFSFTYSLRSVERSELKTMRYDLSSARAERLTLAPQGLVRFAKEDLAPEDELIVLFEQGPDPEMHFTFAPNYDWERDGIERVELLLTYAGKSEAIVIDSPDERPEVSIWHEAAHGFAVTYRSTIGFRAGTGPFDTLTTPDSTTESRFIVLMAPYGVAQVEAAAVGVPFEKYSRVFVDVKVLQPALGYLTETTLELTGERQEAAARVRTSSDDRVIVKRRIRYLPNDGETITDDWEDVSGDDRIFLVVRDPFPDEVIVQVLAAARFGTHVSRLVVEFRPVADSAHVDTVLLTAERPSGTWTWPVQEGQSHDYEYRTVVHTTVGEVLEGTWLPGRRGSLIVGEGFAQLRAIQLLFAGRSLAELGLLGVKVRFAYADPAAGISEESERLVTDLGPPVEWMYPLADPSRLAYTYQLTLVHADGRLEVTEPVTTEDLMIVRVLTP